MKRAPFKDAEIEIRQVFDDEDPVAAQPSACAISASTSSTADEIQRSKGPMTE
ncbi:MAG: hypothetical protein H0T42_33550 [Deltaproteobacteria bacterium]|nr:hypothetical protein [Deltaproteobacteria bacterium]